MAWNTAQAGERRLLAAAALSALLGVALIGMAAATPWHTDADAYLDGLGAIRADLYGDMESRMGTGDFDRASREFHALQDRHATPKWLYADLGYAAVAWALLLTVASAINPALGPDRRWRIVLPASGGAVALIVAGIAASALHAFDRRQVPEWADTLAIPLMGAALIGGLLLPLVLVLAAAPLLLTRRAPASLWSLRGRGWIASVVASLVHLAPLLLGVLCLASIPSPGGWGISTGGAVLIWLMLNARAIWMGHDPASP